MTGMSNVPSEPGAYLDCTGDVWIRSTTGLWIDCKGEMPGHLSEEHMRFLETQAPFVKLPEKMPFRAVYRVYNEDQGYDSDDFALIEEAELDATEEGDVVQAGLRLQTVWEEVKDEEPSNESGS